MSNELPTDTRELIGYARGMVWAYGSYGQAAPMEMITELAKRLDLLTAPPEFPDEDLDRIAGEVVYEGLNFGTNGYEWPKMPIAVQSSAEVFTITITPAKEKGLWDATQESPGCLGGLFGALTPEEVYGWVRNSLSWMNTLPAEQLTTEAPVAEEEQLGVKG